MAKKNSKPQSGKPGLAAVGPGKGEVAQLRPEQMLVEQLRPEQIRSSARPAAPNPSPTPSPAAANRQGPANPSGPASQPAGQAALPPPRTDETADRSAPDPARRTAKRRPAGPARSSIAANDDVPSIGALIYALNQKPSKQPFQIAAIASVVWVVIAGVLGWIMLSSEARQLESFSDLFTRPPLLMVLASILVPLAIVWFLAMLVWRAQELKLMSSAMTEVAVRLAEPDRMAEQAVASLGQNVRRQVAFMNDAVGRALGRAGELEAMVHSEVSALERSYSENEARIRALIDELASERNAIVNNSERVSDSLRGLGSQVAKEITAVSDQASLRMQQTSQQLTTSLQQATDRSSELLSERGNAFLSQLTNVYARLSQDVPQLISKLGEEQGRLSKIIEGAGENLIQLETSLSEHTGNFETKIGERTKHLQTVLGEYTQAIDDTITQRVKALDAAFQIHTQRFDDAISSGSRMLDQSISEKSQALAIAMETQARTLSESMTRQAGSLDETLMQGINSVRRTSENITRQSIKSIEGLANQADLLRKVSENLLGQIHSVTNRFDNQGQQILQAASALEGANLRIDNVLSARQVDLDRLLQSMTEKADSFDRVMQSYSQTLNQQLGEAERRARGVTEEFARGTTQALEGTLSEAERRTQSISQRLAQGTSQALEGPLHAAEQRAQNLGQHIMRGTQAIEGSLNDAEQRARDIGQQIARGTSEALHGSLGEAEKRAQELTQQFARGYASQVAGSLGEAELRAKAMSEQLAKSTEQRQRATIEELERLKREADAKADRTLEELRGKFANVERNVSEQLTGFTDRFDATTSEVQARAAEAAKELEATQAQIRKQAQSLPIATRESADAMRKALQDQLKALESINALANKQATNRDVTPPLAAPQAQPAGAAGPSATDRPRPAGAAPRALDTVTQSLTREMQQRHRGANPGGGVPSADAQSVDGRWSVGDLLARASRPDDPNGHGAFPANSAPDPMLAQLAHAIAPQAASHIWGLIRNGQRGVLGPHVYTNEGHALFESTARQCQVNPAFRALAQRTIADFERRLGDAASGAPGSPSVDELLASDAARSYLVLAHAVGHLS